MKKIMIKMSKKIKTNQMDPKKKCNEEIQDNLTLINMKIYSKIKILRRIVRNLRFHRKM
jgi:hypothetical protein